MKIVENFREEFCYAIRVAKVPTSHRRAFFNTEL